MSGPETALNVSETVSEAEQPIFIWGVWDTSIRLLVINKVVSLMAKQ